MKSHVTENFWQYSVLLLYTLRHLIYVSSSRHYVVAAVAKPSYRLGEGKGKVTSLNTTLHLEIFGSNIFLDLYCVVFRTEGTECVSLFVALCSS